MIEQSYILIHIKLHHEISFGKAVYIVGNCQQLGNWKLKTQTRLQWTQSNNWRKSIVVPKNIQIEYKYVVGNFNQPSNQNVEWEIGCNRIMNIQNVDSNQTYLIENWNTLRFKIILYTPLNIEQPSISGNCPDLGMKVSKLKLTQFKDIVHQNQAQNQIQNQNQKVWTIEFNCSKYKKTLNYYYFARKNGQQNKIRQPGKYFNTNYYNGDNLFGRYNIQYNLGEIVIIQFQDFNGIKITKLSEDIFIGPYIKNIQDIMILKQNGIKAVLNLQTPEDMKRYGINWDFIKKQTSKFGIQSFNFEIIDMNFNDFIQKSSQALKVLRRIMVQYKTVYVHCTAGIFRSPQLFMNYNLQDAIKLIKSKRPFIHPYTQGLNNLINNIYRQFKIIRF